MNDEWPFRAKVTVDPGVCRFKGWIAAMSDGTDIVFEMESDCPHVRKLMGQLHPMGIGEVMRMPFDENGVYRLCGKVLKHSSCPYPMAMIKCAEAAAQLGLKKTVHVEFVE